MTDLHYLSAAEALRLFRTRQLSPVELVTAVTERAEAVEPVLNAFAETFYEQALDQARASEARYAGRGGPVRPLDGLPVAVKEEAEIAGQRNTLGSLPRRDVVAEQTTAFVQRIIDAGAIVHARTTIPGFCCAPITWSRLWGVTRNPWNTRYSPGGASPDDPALASYWAARREKIKPPLDRYTLRLLTAQRGLCPLCGDYLLSADQPPQSPWQWEQWWLHVTWKAIAASYLTHHGRPGLPDDDQTRLVHAPCQRALQARQRRNPALQPATPSRLA